MNLTWVKSRRCESNACVEVTADDEHVYVRDSKDPGGPMFTFTRQEWRELQYIAQGDLLRYP